MQTMAKVDNRYLHIFIQKWCGIHIRKLFKQRLVIKNDLLTFNSL